MKDDGERQQRFERARRMRNYAIAGALLLFVLLLFYLTIVRLGGHVAD
jgi:hypothetical protein